MLKAGLPRLLCSLLLSDCTVHWVHGKGLTDEPLLAGVHQPLSGADAAANWTATSVEAGVSIAAAVPGDLITDLQRAGSIGDPLYERNFKSVLWDATNWTISTQFETSTDLVDCINKAGHAYLVLDGVKMGAWVYLNGNLLCQTRNLFGDCDDMMQGAVTDQFLRYRFDVTKLLLPGGGQNDLRLIFPPSNHTLNTEARWMACSGAWDWAPYTATYNDQKAHTMSKGIWKSVYLVGVPDGEAALEHLQPRIYYNGSYPSAPLTDSTAGAWTVVARVHLVAPNPSGGHGTINVTGSWGGTVSKKVQLYQGENVVELTLPVPAGQVSLWWPNGLGEQTLYNLTVHAEIMPRKDHSNIRSITRRIGFRSVALVTADDSDPSKLAGKDGSGDFTMRLNVNGAKIWSRGANLIPMDEMDGRLTEDAYHFMLKSAKDSGYNTLRVWGGGLYYHDIVYDTADEMGLLMYHDAMYGQPWFGGNSGVAIDNKMQDAELRYQLRRLSAHPCVFIWDACNECGGKGTWGSFVSPTMADEDPSRPIWPACPSTGWKSGVDQLTGLPNGKPLSMKLSGADPGSRSAAAAVSGAVSTQSGASTCTFIENVDYDKGTNWLSTPCGGKGSKAADNACCCDACTKQEGCVVGLLYHQAEKSVCYLKNATQVKFPVWGAGTTASWVAGTKPVTPKVPPAGGCNTDLQMETHGYYQHGEGWKTVNSKSPLQPFSPNVPPTLDKTYKLGADCPGTYASEFGASAWSSFESVSPTLAPEHWGLHADPMFERNYCADNFLTVYFNVSWPLFMAKTGEPALKAQLYLAIVAQSLVVKSDISTRRARNSWGTVTWQHNEIWPTGGWGSIEYGSVGFTKGTVLGGRWKPLQYFFKDHLYTDLFVVCGNDGRCLVKNDSPLKGFNGVLKLTALNVSNSAVIAVNSTAISLHAGAGAATWLCATGGGSPLDETCDSWSDLLAPLDTAPDQAVLMTELLSADGTVQYSSFELLSTPADMLDALPKATVTATVGTPTANGSSVPVKVSTDGAALFVGLTTAAHGRFSRNFFILPQGHVSVDFIPFGILDTAMLAATLRVEHVRSYL